MQSGARAHILVIEDDPVVGELLARVLTSAGYSVRLVGTGAAARAAMDETRPDLIMLDLILPDEDGLLLCAVLKAQSRAPILICSATRRAHDELLSRKLGADDFIAKPFDIYQVTARVEALVLRTTPPPAQPRALRDVLRVGELLVDQELGQATLADNVLQLTPIELRLLTALARKPRVVLTREYLIRQVWGEAGDAGSRAIDVHVGRLRTKLARVHNATITIVAVRGSGYRLDWPLSAAMDRWPASAYAASAIHLTKD